MKQKLISLLPDKLYIYLMYLKTKKKLLNLRNPKSFCEKLQWLKMNGNLEQYARYVDKLEVREYVANTLGKEYLIPLIGCWHGCKDIPFSDLPEQFVLKATHGCGYNDVCHDKSSLDIGVLEKSVSTWLAEVYYKIHREAQYKYCKPRILCEQYLEDEFGELRDYKILCFNGILCVIEVHTSRFSGHTGDYFDTSWNKLNWEIGYSNFPGTISKPENLTKMLSVAQQLAEEFRFVRVDLYSVRQEIYFGELTFTPGNGLTYFGKADSALGQMFDLSGYMK